MSITPVIKKNKIDTILENLGNKYFDYIDRKNKTKDEIYISNIPSDKILQVVSSNISIYTVIIAFLIGALTTTPAVLFEIYHKGDYSIFHYYLILSLLTIIFLVIEIYVLYWLGMRSSYTLTELIGYSDFNRESLPPEYDIKKIMIRSALELDDLSVEYLDLKLDKHISKKWVLVSSLLYKAKVALTSVIMRIFLTKLFARETLRVGFVWVSVPVTAFWDAIVMYRVIKDARLRLFGYHLSKYITEEIFNDNVLRNLSLHTIEGTIRAVSTIIVLAKNYHPNNIILLMRLTNHFDIRKGNDYDNLDKYLEFIENSSKEEKHLFRALSGISAVFDGKLNREEKKALVKIFGDEYDKYMSFTKELKSLLLDSKLHQSANLCYKTLQIK
jgi:hypothetical protein